MNDSSETPSRQGVLWQSWLAAVVSGAGAANVAATPVEPPPVDRSTPAARASSGSAGISGHSVPGGGAKNVVSAVTQAGVSGADVVVYKVVGEQKLKLHIARPSPDKFPGPRPCVVFFHGGAWRTGDPKQFMPFARRLADAGVIGISAQYRLMGDDDVLPLHAVQDARSALRAIRAKAGQLGCDADRIGAGGGSSGGHLAVMAAVPARPGPLGSIDDASDDLKVSPRPQALFLMNSPLNLERYDRPVPMKQRRQLSPIQQIDAGLPPTWIFHGTADKVVPFAQAAEFRDRARALGAANVSIQAFNGRGHGFFNAKRGSGEDFEATVAGILDALKVLGWVDRPQ